VRGAQQPYSAGTALFIFQEIRRLRIPADQHSSGNLQELQAVLVQELAHAAPWDHTLGIWRAG
jgi:hypothetical protein